jgi:lipoate---protein ligase
MLWQSEKAVVVGKHQNLLAEINYPFVLENNIALCPPDFGWRNCFS